MKFLKHSKTLVVLLSLVSSSAMATTGFNINGERTQTYIIKGGNVGSASVSESEALPKNLKCSIYIEPQGSSSFSGESQEINVAKGSSQAVVYKNVLVEIKNSSGAAFQIILKNIYSKSSLWPAARGAGSLHEGGFLLQGSSAEIGQYQVKCY